MRGRFDVVVVQRFDQAARSVKQLVETLEHLRRCRVAFVSLKEDVDTPTPAGELIFHVMATIGQFVEWFGPPPSARLRDPMR